MVRIQLFSKLNAKLNHTVFLQYFCKISKTRSKFYTCYKLWHLSKNSRSVHWYRSLNLQSIRVTKQDLCVVWPTRCLHSQATVFVRPPINYSTYLNFYRFYSFFMYPSKFDFNFTSSLLLVSRDFHKQAWVYENDWFSSVQLVKWYTNYLGLLQVEHLVSITSIQSELHLHQLRFRFIGSRLTILLTNLDTRTDHFFVSAGIFTRYFFFQKSVKKSKVLKLIMVRFIRKMLIMLQLGEVTLRVRGVPFMFEQLVTTMLASLRHPFINPLTGEVFDEVNTHGASLSIKLLTFINTQPFGFMKTRLKGRIKRKIRRRIYRLNRSDC